MTSASLIAWSACAASFSAVHCPAAAVASSRSSYLIVKLPAFHWASSGAIVMPWTIVSVCPLALPVRGRLETILIMVGSPWARPKVARRGNKRRERKGREIMVPLLFLLGWGDSRPAPDLESTKTADGPYTTPTERRSQVLY